MLSEKFDSLKAIGEMFNHVDKALKRHAFLNNEIKRLENILCDLNHELELTNFNAYEGWKRAKRIQQTLVQRREVKDELEMLDSCIDFLKPLHSKLINVKGTVSGKAKTKQERRYRLRELKPNEVSIPESKLLL